MNAPTPAKIASPSHLAQVYARRTGRWAQIRPYDVANGPGIRVSVFVSGCTHACPGCFNAEYQDFRYGNTWDEATTAMLLEYLADPAVAGLTLLGGEPLQNLWLIPILARVREHTDKGIWVYSGYTFEQAANHAGRRALLSYCDVLVDGLFEQAQRDLRLRFRGSANQRLIDLEASLHAGRAICLDEAALDRADRPVLPYQAVAAPAAASAAS